MATKAKRKRIIKPAISVKPVIPVIQANPDGMISIPVSPDAISSCDGCFFYDEPEEKCNDTESRDCTGVIFVKE